MTTGLLRGNKSLVLPTRRAAPFALCSLPSYLAAVREEASFVSCQKEEENSEQTGSFLLQSSSAIKGPSNSTLLWLLPTPAEKSNPFPLNPFCISFHFPHKSRQIWRIFEGFALWGIEISGEEEKEGQEKWRKQLKNGTSRCPSSPALISQPRSSPTSAVLSRYCRFLFNL